MKNNKNINANADGKKAKALEALEGLGEATKAAKKNK